MMKTVTASIIGILTVAALSFYSGYETGKRVERISGQAVQEATVALQACSKANNVWLGNCAMKAVVVEPREEPAPEKTAAYPELLPMPEGYKG